jgi:hypothetical protein
MALLSLPIVPAPVEYRDIPGFPGYRVGDDGSVWSRRYRRQWVRFVVRRNGFKTIVATRINGKLRCLTVGRLVLLSFVGPCPADMECCHGDGNPFNNRLDNLRWDTHISNEADKRKHGTLIVGSRNAFAKLSESDIPAMRFLQSHGYTQREIASIFGVSGPKVCRVLSGKCWPHMRAEQ